MTEDGGTQMQEFDAELTCGSSRSRTGRRDTVRRECGHGGSPHAHGTRAAYVSDRCGCTRCRAANRAAEEHRTTAITVGQWHPYADAPTVREHLQRLRHNGFGVERIAQLANVSKATVQRLLSYPPDQKVQPRRVRAATAKRLLALPVTNEVGSPRGLVAAGATRRQIDTLTMAGHSLPELALMIGRSPTSLRRSLSRRSVTNQTAMTVTALYQSLSQAGPAASRQIPSLTPPIPDALPVQTVPLHSHERRDAASPQVYCGTSRKSRRVALEYRGLSASVTIE